MNRCVQSSAILTCTSWLHFPASALVVTMTLHRLNSSSTSSTAVGRFSSVPTTGLSTFAASSTERGCFRIPSEKNFNAICVLSASVGTITMTRVHMPEIIAANIVSVFPVPVGITTVATSLLVDQWA